MTQTIQDVVREIAREVHTEIRLEEDSLPTLAERLARSGARIEYEWSKND